MNLTDRRVCYMMECVAIESPRDLLGTVALSKRGRDKDKLYIILGWTPGDFAIVADGKTRVVAKPKKKNMKHLKFSRRRPGELGYKILNGERVTDRMIREGLAVFREQMTDWRSM